MSDGAESVRKYVEMESVRKCTDESEHMADINQPEVE
jgi:hypothetical protein